MAQAVWGDGRAIPCLYQRPDGEYVIVPLDRGRRHRRIIRTNRVTLEGAVLEWRRWDLDPEGYLRGQNTQKVRDILPLAEQYLEQTAGRRTPETRALTRTRLLAFIEPLRTTADVRLEILQPHLNKLMQIQGPATLRRRWITFASFMRWLVRAEMITEDRWKWVADRISLPPKPPPREDRCRIVRLAEIRALNLPPATRVAYMILWATGMRRAELDYVRVSDMQIASGYLYLRKCKGAQSRRVPIHDPNCWVALTHQAFHVLRGWRSKWLEADMSALKKRGEEPITPHTLRHSRISLWIAQGYPIQDVMLWSGHKQLATTLLYTHPTGKASRGADLEEQLTMEDVSIPGEMLPIPTDASKEALAQELQKLQKGTGNGCGQ
jgi:integrase/recombinase XerD